MTQCQRCGASNESHSRFCVSCGSPLIDPQRPPAPAPAVSPGPPQQGGSYPGAPPAGSYPGAQPGAGYPGGAQAPTQPQPQWGAPAPYNPPPAHWEQASPSASLPFAQTASPQSQAEHEARLAAAQALAGQQGYAPLPTAPPPYPPPGGGYAPPPAYRGPTAAMPGVAQDPDVIPEGAPRILSGFLVSYEQDAHGRFWLVRQGKNVIGREGAAPGLDIEIGHPTTSSRHALLLASAQPGRIKIEDLGSTNGTFVNEVKLPPGHREELRDGDRIRFGLFSAVVKII